MVVEEVSRAAEAVDLTIMLLAAVVVAVAELAWEPGNHPLLLPSSKRLLLAVNTSPAPEELRGITLRWAPLLPNFSIPIRLNPPSNTEGGDRVHKAPILQVLRLRPECVVEFSTLRVDRRVLRLVELLRLPLSCNLLVPRNLW